MNSQLDQTGIIIQLKINYGMKTIKLFLLLLNITYIMFIGWFIYCEIVSEMFDQEVSFISDNELHPHEARSMSEIVWTIMYYGCTTLSTVGFGDIVPLNSAERLVCAFIMLFGVAITSLVLSWFLDIIATFKSFDIDLCEEHQDQLECFFDCIKKQFNK